MSKEICSNEQLVIQIKAGIDVAENMLKLWQQNQGFIVAIAKRFRGYEEIDDLIQQGYIGLCQAVDGYNPDEGVPFINYAGFWIRQNMQRYIEDCGSVVRIPVNLRSKIGKYKRLIAAFLAQFDRKPTDQEACYYLGISSERLGKLKKAMLMDDMGSLDMPIGEGEEGSLYDLLPGQESLEDDVVEKLLQEQLRDTLWGMVDELPGQQPTVIRLRYQEGKTLKEMGESIGCSLQQASTIQNKALRAMREPRRANVLRSFMYGDIYSNALRGNGVGQFSRTWTSSTERAAIVMAEVEEEINSELEKLRSGSR